MQKNEHIKEKGNVDMLYNGTINDVDDIYVVQEIPVDPIGIIDLWNMTDLLYHKDENKLYTLDEVRNNSALYDVVKPHIFDLPYEMAKVDISYAKLFIDFYGQMVSEQIEIPLGRYVRLGILSDPDNYITATTETKYAYSSSRIGSNYNAKKSFRGVTSLYYTGFDTIYSSSGLSLEGVLIPPELTEPERFQVTEKTPYDVDFEKHAIVPNPEVCQSIARCQPDPKIDTKGLCSTYQCYLEVEAGVIGDNGAPMAEPLVPAGAAVELKVDVQGLGQCAEEDIQVIWTVDNILVGSGVSYMHTFETPGVHPVGVLAGCRNEEVRCVPDYDMFDVTVWGVELVDETGATLTKSAIANIADPNFVSWGSAVSVKYKLKPEGVTLPDNAYSIKVLSATSTKTGRHDGLGISYPSVKGIDKSNNIISFTLRVTGGNTNGSKDKAQPLAVKIIFETSEGNKIKELLLQQDDRNVIREEYRAYALAESYRPKESYFDGELKAENYPNASYSASDVPKGKKLNDLIDPLPDGKYGLTSTYRNPYRNKYIGSNSMKSRHVWSGAMDVQDSNNKGFSNQLKEVWTVAKGESSYKKVLIEASDGLILTFLINYLGDEQIDFIDGSVGITSMPDLHSRTYAIVWSSAAGWKKVKYEWKEKDSTNNEMTKNGEYTFKETDWDSIARNLHIQDRSSSGYGF